MHLLNPIIIRLKQDQVLLAYPFNYLSAVNGKASEVVINYENKKNFTGCDDSSPVNPTCGKMYEKGVAIDYSEGFCCFCPELPVNEKQTRGGQDCSLDVGDPSDIEKQKYKASAHCLIMSDVWYTVSALRKPIIIHEVYLQVYNQRHLKNESSVWVALTHDQEFEMGIKNPYQFDDNKTILVSYKTLNPSETSITIPVNERRLLIPQPMPAVESGKLPIPVKNGARDYILIPKTLVNPDGDDCNVAGVSYKAFAKQNDRCNVAKDTCLENQPLDLWEADDEKRQLGDKGNYILQNYGIPYKDPIIVHPDTKEHWLALEYHEKHQTEITVEINADEIAILNVGKKAQISKVISSSMRDGISIHVSLLNGGLMPAKFVVQLVKCEFGIVDSDSESAVIPPQMTHDYILTTKPGALALIEKFTCQVEVSNEQYGLVAKRAVAVKPSDRCVCNFHCQCTCMSEGLMCEQMKEEDYLAAGFQGSLPILTAKPPYKPWLRKHPYIALLVLLLLLLLFGFIKAIFGFAGFAKFGQFGLKKCVYHPKKMRHYFEPYLKNVEVEYDAEGYPINPDTKERVRVISEEMLFAMNCCFCCFWPYLRLRDFISKKLKASKGKKGNSESSKQTRKQDKEIELVETDNLLSSDSPVPPSPSRQPKKGDHSEPLKRDAPAYQRHPVGAKKARASKSDSLLETETTGPIADPLNKELAHWQKGRHKIKAVTK